MAVEAILLGTAQDGGVPQAGCGCAHCQQAQRDPAARQMVSCLAMVDRQQRSAWMIDATPDFRQQLHLLQTLAPDCELKGIFITHAHMGHYTGLIHLGREAMNTRGLPLYATASFGGFLAANAPWKQLLELGNIVWQEVYDRQPVRLSPNLRIEPVQVPHRGEFSDTVGYVLRGPARSLFYCPDIDHWTGEELDMRLLLEQVDLALLDGTFFAAGELPAQRMGEVPHPLVKESAALFQGSEERITFVHLNHTNPLWQAGVERRWLEQKGFSVGEEGRSWSLF
jgi:pyrroloquinoline quinone biosynthesis protein B